VLPVGVISFEIVVVVVVTSNNTVAAAVPTAVVVLELMAFVLRRTAQLLVEVVLVVLVVLVEVVLAVLVADSKLRNNPNTVSPDVDNSTVAGYTTANTDWKDSIHTKRDTAIASERLVVLLMIDLPRH